MWPKLTLFETKKPKKAHLSYHLSPPSHQFWSRRCTSVWKKEEEGSILIWLPSCSFRGAKRQKRQAVSLLGCIQIMYAIPNTLETNTLKILNSYFSLSRKECFPWGGLSLRWPCLGLCTGHKVVFRLLITCSQWVPQLLQRQTEQPADNSLHVAVPAKSKVTAGLAQVSFPKCSPVCLWCQSFTTQVCRVQ